YYGYTYSQSIYLQSEINLENQRIERLAYYWNGAGVGNLSNGWTIYMGHTSQSIFTSTSGWIPLNQLTPVYIGQPDIPATPGWIEVMLTIPFIYNNTDNLIIAVHENTPSYNGSAQFFFSTPTSSNRSLRYYSDSVNPDPASPPAGTVVTGFPNIKLTMGDVPTTPVFQIHPAGDYNFGDVNIGGSKRKTFTVSNYGIGSLGITNISITGSSAMSLGTIPDLPVYLQIAQSLEVEVTYSPSLLGQDTATLSFTDDLNNRYVLDENSVLTLANAGSTSRDTHTITLTGTGVNDITLGDGSQSARMPMDFYYRSSLYETVFTQDELNNFLGLITGLKLYNSFSSNLNNKPVKIWLGSTTQANLENGFIPADQLELVYDGPMDFPSGENTISFTFPEPYLHLDGGNLVMMIRRPMDTSYHSSSDQFKCQTGNTNRARNLYSDSIDYDENNPGAGTATGIYPKITFTVIPGGVGHINGTVLGPDGNPLPGVTVTLDGRPISIQTDQQGYFSIPNQLPNHYSLTFTKHTYVTQVISFELEEDETEVVDITMQLMPQVTVSGTILASDTGEGIAGANIRFTGYETFMGSSTANGSFTMPNVFANQTYNYLISAAGYVSTTGELNLGAANHNMGEITLSEVAYAPNTVIADLNATYDTVNLSWNAPDPNAVEITESFEDAEFPPAGWSQVITNTGAANTLGVYPTWCSFGAINTGSGLVEPTEGAKQAGLWWVTEHQDEWLKTPAFNCPPDAYMTFDTYATYGSPNGDHYYVKISNNSGNTWTALWDASVLPEGTNNYQNPITIDLANYAGSEVILAFHADDPPSNDGLWNHWFIDNIYIGNMVQTISFNGSDLIPGRISINSGLGANSSPNTEL
ncbi:MAG: carboxypeptidase regulatory-like domain-containing protein, partial [Candidatus Cloacimonadaceae bacterium]